MSPANSARKQSDSVAPEQDNSQSGFIVRSHKHINRVLVIDDTPAIQSLVKRILALANIEAIMASDGEEGVALHAMLGLGVDVVLLDYEMPKMNGLDVLKQIMRERPETPVVFFSGAGGDEWMDLARSAGAASILKKPFLPSDLINALHAAVDIDMALQKG